MFEGEVSETGMIANPAEGSKAIDEEGKSTEMKVYIGILEFFRRLIVGTPVSDEVDELRRQTEEERQCIELRFVDYGGPGYGYHEICEELKTALSDELKELHELKNMYYSWKERKWDPLFFRMGEIGQSRLDEREVHLQAELQDFGGPQYTIFQACKDLDDDLDDDLQVIVDLYTEFQILKREFDEVFSDLVQLRYSKQITELLSTIDRYHLSITEKLKDIPVRKDESISSYDELTELIEDRENELCELHRMKANGKARGLTKKLETFRDLKEMCDAYRAHWKEFMELKSSSKIDYPHPDSASLPLLIMSLRPTKVPILVPPVGGNKINSQLKIPECAESTLQLLIQDYSCHAEGRGRVLSAGARAVTFAQLQRQTQAEGVVDELPTASNGLRYLSILRSNELKELQSSLNVMKVDTIELRDLLLKDPDCIASVKIESGVQLATLEESLEKIRLFLDQECSECQELVTDISEGANIDQLVTELTTLWRDREQMVASGPEKGIAAELIGRLQSTWAIIDSVYRRYSADYLQHATSLLAELRPLDVDLIVQLIEECDAVAHQIRGKDIVLLLGSTGTGKTTTIRSLAGPALAAQMTSFVASASAISVTRTINSIQIPYHSDGVEKVLILCDSAGFMDNRSVEISIANNIGMQRALRGCASITPLVLQSPGSIKDRFDGAVEMASILSGMFANAHELTATVEGGQCTRRSAFNYVFTKFDDSMSARLWSGLQVKANSMPKGQLRNIVQDMANHACTGDIQAVGSTGKIDAVLACPKKALLLSAPAKQEELALIFERLERSGSIRDLSETVRDFTDATADKAISQMLTVRHLGIVSDLKCSNCTATERLAFKFDELKLFASVAHLKETQQAYNKSVKSLFEFIKSLKTAIESEISRIMDEESIAVEADIQGCLSKMFHLVSLESVRRANYYEGCGGSDRALDEYGVHQLSKGLAAILVACDRQVDVLRRLTVAAKPYEIVIHSPNLYEQMCKLGNNLQKLGFAYVHARTYSRPEVMSSTLSKFVEQDILPMYSDACCSTREVCESALDAALEATEKSRFCECLNYLAALRSCLPVWSVHIDSEDFSSSSKYSEAVARFESTMLSQCYEWRVRVLEGKFEEGDISQSGALFLLLKNCERVSDDYRAPHLCDISTLRKNLTAITTTAKEYISESILMFETEKITMDSSEVGSSNDLYSFSFFTVMKVRFEKMALIERLLGSDVSAEYKLFQDSLVNLLSSYKTACHEIVERLFALEPERVSALSAPTQSMLKSCGIDCNHFKYLLHQLFQASMLGSTFFEDIFNRFSTYVRSHRKFADTKSSSTLTEEVDRESTSPILKVSTMQPFLGIGYEHSVREFARPFCLISCLLSALDWPIDDHCTDPYVQKIAAALVCLRESGKAVVSQVRVIADNLTTSVELLARQLSTHNAESVADHLQSKELFHGIEQILSYLKACVDSRDFFWIDGESNDILDAAPKFQRVQSILEEHIDAVHNRLVIQSKHSWIVTKPVKPAPEGLEDEAMRELHCGITYLRYLEDSCKSSFVFQSRLDVWKGSLEFYHDEMTVVSRGVATEDIVNSVRLLMALDSLMSDRKFKDLYKKVQTHIAKHLRSTEISIKRDEYGHLLRDRLVQLHAASPEDFERHCEKIEERVSHIVSSVDNDIRHFQLSSTSHGLFDKLNKLHCVELLTHAHPAIADSIYMRNHVNHIGSFMKNLSNRIEKEFNSFKVDRFDFLAIEMNLDAVTGLLTEMQAFDWTVEALGSTAKDSIASPPPSPQTMVSFESLDKHQLCLWLFNIGTSADDVESFHLAGMDGGYLADLEHNHELVEEGIHLSDADFSVLMERIAAAKKDGIDTRLIPLVETSVDAAAANRASAVETQIASYVRTTATSLRELLQRNRTVIDKCFEKHFQQCGLMNAARSEVTIDPSSCPPPDFWDKLEATISSPFVKLLDNKFYSNWKGKLLERLVEQLTIFLLRASQLHGIEPAPGCIVAIQLGDLWAIGETVRFESDGGEFYFVVKCEGVEMRVEAASMPLLSIEEADHMMRAYYDLPLHPLIKSEPRLRKFLRATEARLDSEKEEGQEQIKMLPNASLEALVEMLVLFHSRRNRTSVRAIEAHLHTRMQQQYRPDSHVVTVVNNLFCDAKAWQKYFSIKKQIYQEFMSAIQESLGYRIREILQQFEGIGESSYDSVQQYALHFESLSAIKDLACAFKLNSNDDGEVFIASVCIELSNQNHDWMSRSQEKLTELAQIFFQWVQNCAEGGRILYTTVRDAIDGTFHTVSWDTLFRRIKMSYENLQRGRTLWTQIHSTCAKETDEKYLQIQNCKQDFLVELRTDVQTLLATCRDHVIGHPDYWDDKLRTSTPNPSDHDNFYRGLNICLKVFLFCKELIASVDSFEDLESHIERQIRDNFPSRARACLAATHGTSFDITKFNTCADNLRSASISLVDNLKLKHLAAECKRELDLMFFQYVEDERRHISRQNGVIDTAEGLAFLRSIGAQADLYTKEVNKMIAQILEEFKKGEDGALFICNLVGQLESSPNGALIVAENAVFEQFRNYDMNQKFSQLTIEKLLQSLRGSALERGFDNRKGGSIYNAYCNIMLFYVEHVKRGKKDRTFVGSIPAETTLIILGTDDMNMKIVKVVAYVLAYWSLSNLRGYDDGLKARTGNYDRADFFITMPHVGQVVAILRILGCDNAVSSGHIDTGVVGASGNGLGGNAWRYAGAVGGYIGGYIGVGGSGTGGGSGRESGGGGGGGSGRGAGGGRAGSGGRKDASHTKSKPTNTRGVINSPPTLHNHFVELSTGEGKSLVLAVTAVVLALFGFDVDCGCYSEYLSERDGESFKSLFGAFGVVENIKYGTFNYLCEQLLNKHGEVRALVEARLNNAPARSTAGHGSTGGLSPRPSVLLIDEVDVFFNPKFYGMPYSSLTRVRSAEIEGLARLVWSKRGTGKSPLQILDEVLESVQYTSCAAKYSAWTSLIDGQEVSLVEEAADKMVSDMLSFEDPSHKYMVIDGKIHYSDGSDKTTTSMVKGYKTMFAYFKAHGDGDVTEAELNEQICMLLKSGSFSYAEIPKLYVNVMGVTGTLETLSEPEKEVLVSRYSVRKNTFIPSVYGKNKVRFSKDSPADMKICETASWYSELVNEIGARLHPVGGHSMRAVMVFFDTQKDLEEFRSSSECQTGHSHFNPNELHVFTASTPVEFYETSVMKAVVPGTVTLLTKELGRGTNFKSADKELNASGGVAVIQTFVSFEYSEEVQIKGRTGRQGDNGSFCMVLDAAALEQIDMSPTEVQAMHDTGRFHTMIHAKRTKKFADDYPEKVKFVNSVAEVHRESLQFLKHLIAGPTHDTSVCEYLVKNNKASNAMKGGVLSRTVVAIDATGSMSGTLDACKRTVMLMFEEAYNVLKKKRCGGAFELQICFYRNYSSKDDIFVESTWESEPTNIADFVEKTRVSGGQGNEAVEVALQYVTGLATGQVTQVILIGDMPPNTPAEVTSRRACGHDWSKTRYAAPTHVDTEIAKLKDSKIAVHAFWVDKSAQAAFQRIAAETGGSCCELEISGEKGATMLKELVCKEVLRQVGTRHWGNASAGDELVAEYERLFGSGYTK